ncbi:MAG: sigma-70 family RNA polymerase sigma factor [Acidobacteriota bacterium]
MTEPIAHNGDERDIGEIDEAESRTISFEALTMPHINDLFRTAQRVLRDRGAAEDIVQEVYLQAWKSFDRFEVGTNCRAWLFKIMFHVISHHRRKWYKFDLFSDSEESLENARWEPPVPEHLTDEEVLMALDEIPEQYRAVILLVDVEEFSYKEAAAVLQVPPGTVMSRLSRGRSLLRSKLASYAGIAKVESVAVTA